MQLTGLHYVVDIDIKGFFDNVCHSKLIRQIWQMGIRDKKLLCIIKKMLKAPIVLPNDETIYPDKGTPQGGILSPLLSNIVLNELDWWIVSQWEAMPTHIKELPIAIRVGRPRPNRGLDIYLYRRIPRRLFRAHGQMGAELFDLPWVEAVTMFFDNFASRQRGRDTELEIVA